MKRTPVLIGIVAAVALVLAAILIGRTGQQPPSSPADPNDTRQVALGEHVYGDQCAACHGQDLEGQADWRSRRPDGRLPAPPHDETGHTWHHPDDVLFRITKDGVAALVPGYESDMPAYADLLTDQEIWAVLAFIKSRWPPAVQSRQAEINRHSDQSR